MTPRLALAAALACVGCEVSDIPPEPNIVDGDTGVAPVARIRLPLDPSTDQSAVTGDAFTMTDERGFPLPVTATLDAELMVAELTAIRPMERGTTYQLASALRDLDGEAIALSFTTLENPILRQIDYLLGTTEPTRYTQEEDDVSISYEAPGLDGIWFNSDDEIGSFTVTEERVGDRQRVVTFNPGEDNQVFTPDDSPASYRINIFEGPLVVRQLTFLGVGPDGELETADDTLRQFRDREYNEDGQLTRFSIFFDGGDNLPDSADDTLVFIAVSEYDERGLQTRFITVNPGPDNVLGTEDDVIPAGPPTILHDDRGVYVGSDDGSFRCTNYVDRRGLYLREDCFDPGLDREMNTADDRFQLRLEYVTP